MRIIIGAMALAVMLPGCVTAIKHTEVDNALRSVGFTREDARCLASRSSRQLSIGQLRSLQRAASAMDQPIREMPVGDVIDAIRNHVDDDTLVAVGRMAADCMQARTSATGA
ncbi:hypothetical protein [Sandaracinobacter neustonicus]|uniref:hypothetical protein n=1 Tax=Sandaracinobacter neustonicus TaxID=1715348 RepID=UPI0015E3D65B|nr:hypothetical protein [Sandaracinobacter neustonicus]